MYSQILKLYHCNTDDNIDKAIETSNYSVLKSEKDKFWIGNGIYFWDNLSNAKYWKREKERKTYNKGIKFKFSIGTGIVQLDNLLDLTDSDIRKEVENILKTIYENNPKLEDKGFGEKINFIFKERQQFKTNYDVIRAHGHYPRQSTKLYYYNQYKVGLTPQVKTIYNVVNDRAIIEFKKEVS